MAKVPELLDGAHPAIVTNNHDPLDMGRVKVIFPWMDDRTESHWARVVQPYAGRERGLYFIPEVGDEVLVVFELGDFNQPLVLGGTWNGREPAPEPGDPGGSNHHKIIETRAGHTLVFSDEPGEEYVQILDSSLKNCVRWDSKTDSVSITAATGDIIVRAPQGAINLLAKDVSFTATDSAVREVGGDESITVKESATEIQRDKKTWTAQSSLAGKAKTLTFQAADDLTVEGGSAGVAASAQTAEDAFVIQGATDDTATAVTVESESAFDRAASRSWTVGSGSFAGKALTFDATGTLGFAGGLFDLDAGGQFSLLGDFVQLQGGLITFKDCGAIYFNPQTPPPPGPAIPGRLIARTAATGF